MEALPVDALDPERPEQSVRVSGLAGFRSLLRAFAASPPCAALCLAGLKQRLWREYMA